MFDIPALLLSVLLNVVLATAAAPSVQGQVLRNLYTKVTLGCIYMTPETPPLSSRPKWIFIINYKWKKYNIPLGWKICTTAFFFISI